MNKQEFIEYFLSFYGEGGLYPETLPGLTIEQIKLGMDMRGDNFDGDSMDREAIRDMILVATNRLGGAFEIRISK